MAPPSPAGEGWGEGPPKASDVIPPTAFAFLRDLAANNDRTWFEANRPTYEASVRNPAAALVAEVTTELTRRALPLEGDAKRSMFRIHRDTRFSKNKLPYKTSIGLVWYRQGSSKGGPGILYFHLDPAGCFVAAAFYHPDPEILDAIRERIRVHPDRFAAMQADLAAAKLTLADAESLTRMPKGFEDLKGTAIDPALRLKHFIVRRALTDRTVQGRALPTKIADLAEQALPLLSFGWAAVDETAP